MILNKKDVGSVNKIESASFLYSEVVMNNLVAIYCRLSEEDRNKRNRDDDSGSIQNQKMMLKEFADMQGWEIFKIYSDDDYAGSDRSRPAFNELITDAKLRKFNIVLCKTQSRFTRELEIVEKYIHGLFPQLGIRFVSIVDNIDTDIAGNKKSRQINGLINEWYLEDMSDSIKAALRTRMKAGYFIGSFAPYGYKKDPENKGHLIIDEEAADVVREIFALYNSGYGRTTIARMLNDRGILSPERYFLQSGVKKNRNGKQEQGFWKYYTVSHILENEVYIGNLVQGRTHNPTYKSKHSVPTERNKWVIIEKAHEPIIDRSTWETTRRLWNERSKPCYNGEVNKYAGKLICAKCGYNMGVAYNKHKRYYRCNSSKYGRQCCTGTSIFEVTLDKALLKEINALRKEYLNADDIINGCDIFNEVNTKIEHIRKQISSLENRINGYESALKNLYLDKLRGIITEVQFVSLTHSLEQDKISDDIRLNSLRDELDKELSKSESEEQRRLAVSELISFDSITREFVESFIRSIEVGGTKNDRVINVFWNF